MPTNPIIIRSQPGVQRDGTLFAGDAYSDALWCRFQRGLPKKMGGFIALTDTLPEVVYGMSSFAQAGKIYQHLGSTSYLTQARSNYSGNFLGLSDRTPAASFSPSVDNLWQFDIIADPSGGNARVIAHAGANRVDIDSETESAVFVGDANATTPLIATAMDPVSGGIVVLYPYLLSFSNAGRVDVSDKEDLTVAPIDSVFVTGSKIVKGLSLRGSGGGPSGLLWSLDSLIRATFNSADPAQGIFAFDTIADDISSLSSRGVISNLGIYYWPGVDCFYMFNGVVREIPNDMCSNFFFDNLNFTYRQKVFAYKVPRYGEIWWCFPKGNATECNHAVVYNYRGNYWFDTPLPQGGRSDGIFAKVYDKPFMAGIDSSATTQTIWQHETGTDAINGSDIQPIRSYFETASISLLELPENANSKSLRVERVEPDFVQSGNLSLTVTGESNARAPTIESVTKTFPDSATSADEQTVTFKDGIRRIMRFKFESNTTGGNYEMGQIAAFVEPDDQRITT